MRTVTGEVDREEDLGGDWDRPLDGLRDTDVFRDISGINVPFRARRAAAGAFTRTNT